MTPMVTAALSGQRRRSRRTKQATPRKRWVCARCKTDHGAKRPDVCSCGSRRFGAQWVRLELRLEPTEREGWTQCASREGYFSVSDWVRDVCNGRVRTRVLTSSDSTSHNTPPVVLRMLRAFGRIALDPCSNATSIVRARVEWTKEDDGLPRSWVAPGLVFVNPPFGDELPTWIDKMIAEAARGAEIVALVPARTDTKWFERVTAVADVGFWKGRLKFGNAKNAAPFAVALLYFGPRRALFRRVVKPHCVRVLDAVAPVWRKPSSRLVQEFVAGERARLRLIRSAPSSVTPAVTTSDRAARRAKRAA